MALTATAQSALPREPTWDEVIVPALRKRLKDESSVLAKRISAASITSIEEQAAQYYAARPGTSTSSNSQSRPSAIPRPSLQSSRTADSSAGVHAEAHPPTAPRARALSQPYAFHPPPPPSADSPTLPDNTRPISPINAPKGTRIPVSRVRTGSTSSQAQSTVNGIMGRPNGAVGYLKHNAEVSETHLWPVEEKVQAQSQTSRSTVRIPRHQGSDIFQEQAPFPNSLSSSQSHLDHGYGRQSPERMSFESEERPFEHWYRGDVARNGGVGELRVARRQEMLDIANYGHTLGKASGKLANSGHSSRSRSNSRGRDMSNGRLHTRPRVGSVGARESIYIDQDEIVGEDAVMDERPPTDLESDGYEDQLDEYYTQAVLPHPTGSISSPSLDRSDTPTSRITVRSRIPQPTQRSRTTTPTPGKPTRSAESGGMSGPSSPPGSSKVPRSLSQPKAQAQAQSQPTTPILPPSSSPSTPTAKRRGKSPASGAPASVSKKAKTKTAPPSSMQKKGARENENRRSLGQYPSPEGDENAIPTWTQPVPANGNWDEVVLPVVARKKGLQDQYENADGSPKPKPPEQVVIEPAPGTFGFDPSRYRRRYSANPEQITMDEFGHKPVPMVHELVVRGPERFEKSPSLVSSHTPSSFTPSNRGSSPPPFARYTGNMPPTAQDQPQMSESKPPEAKQQKPDDGGGESAGCCKCVIM